MVKNNVHVIPSKKLNKVEAAMEELTRIMPKQAELAMVMRNDFVESGFTEDEALKLTAYALFR